MTDGPSLIAAKCPTDGSGGNQMYRPRRIYRLLAIAGVAVAMLFLWEIMNRFSVAALFFLLATIGFAVVYLRWTLMRLELTPDGLTVHAPLQPPLHILFRQMVTCAEAGRVTSGLSLVYWPMIRCSHDARNLRCAHIETADGFVDTDAPRTLFLPAVKRQEKLLAVMREMRVEK